MNTEPTNLTPEKSQSSPNSNNNKNKRFAIFQCGKCYKTFGNSKSWSSSNIYLQAFILNTVEEKSITKGTRLRTSSKGPDYGSAYYDLICSNCSSVIGRWYKTTSPSFDNARETYTIYIHRTSTYFVGLNKKGVTWSSEYEVPILHPSSEEIGKRISQLEALTLVMANKTQNIGKVAQSLSINLQKGMNSTVSKVIDKKVESINKDIIEIKEGIRTK